MAMETQAHPIIEDGGSLQAIRYERGSLQLLDQRKLPLETVYIDIKGSADGWHAIKDMVIRGAPAIAISAALSLAVEVVHRDRKIDENAQDALEFLESRLKYLASSRPTAVNLVDASTKLQNTAREALVKSSQADSVFKAYVEAAEEMLVADIATNKAIGQNGANYLLSACKNPRGSKGLNILTHCNTGSLATAGYGTALGVIRSLHSVGKLETVFLTETRPYNQGSRLTAYELVHENIPATLVADSAAASLQMSGRVDAVIVGADRIAANGDTANKIGTYSLALAAFHHNIPFYVAAPLTSIDISLPSGESIEIEERSPLELTHSHGGHGPQIAASGISVWNPAFDVTPAKLITGIITDKGIIVKKDGSATFDVQAFISDDQIPSSVKEMQANGPVVKNDLNFDVQSNHAEYFPLDATSIKSYIGRIPKLAERLGGSRSELNLQEVGDGNLNYVFIVHGPAGSFVIKQALPYVRCVGESWPLALDRSYYEAMALKEHGVLAPEHVPEVYHFDYKMALTVMRYLEPPHIILRKGLISGMVYPLLAEHVSDYMAKTLFNTSLLAITTTKHKSTMAKFAGNVSLCRLTEQVIFTEPYMVASNNHWTSPQLDEDAKAVRLDDLLKLEIAGLKAKFCESSQALIHGDLHTGSIMVTATSTQVIDPEFAFCGPMGFDIGAFLGNLLLAFFSQDGHAVGKDREEYKLWILQTVADSWNLFQKKFLTLWDRTWSNPGDAYPAAVYDTPKARELAQQSYIAQIFEDTLGFAAAKMIRRIVGIAHVEDFESVTDKDVRAACERRALNAAKLLLKERRKFSTIGQVLDVIQNIQ